MNNNELVKEIKRIQAYDYPSDSELGINTSDYWNDSCRYSRMNFPHKIKGIWKSPTWLQGFWWRVTRAWEILTGKEGEDYDS
jgi:hypothetical protein